MKMMFDVSILCLVGQTLSFWEMGDGIGSTHVPSNSSTKKKHYSWVVEDSGGIMWWKI